MELKQFDEALPLWRRIARGLEQGEDWLEAKYHIAMCLAPTSPNEAGDILQQATVLAGELPAHWQARFDQLEAQLKLDQNR
jgi:hypothetical protein